MPDQNTDNRPSSGHIYVQKRRTHQHGVGKQLGLTVKLLISQSVHQWCFIMLCGFVLWFLIRYSAKLHITNKKVIKLEAEVHNIQGGNILGDPPAMLKMMEERLIKLEKRVQHMQEDENLQSMVGKLHMLEKKITELETQIRYVREVQDSWILGLLIAPKDIGSWNEITTRQVPCHTTQLSKTPEATSLDSTQNTTNNAMITFSQVLQMIKNVTQDALKKFNKDKDGRRDFAFIQMGGSVIASLTSKSISLTSSSIGPLKAPTSLRTLFASLSGRPLVTFPKIALLGNGSIGTCWAFSGSTGQLGIALSDTINITGVTVKHIGKELAQDSISVAPKDFELWVLMEGKDIHSEIFLFGGFYDATKASIAQTFDFAPTRQAYTKVIFKINSNHGNHDYKCVYRVRIHGIM
ncbi:UNC-like C-terminal-domain-containing protein [Melampsora americana]|nr:UNC-like C-terminal-domain-containing protein [Melampsora americana]